MIQPPHPLTLLLLSLFFFMDHAAYSSNQAKETLPLVRSAKAAARILIAANDTLAPLPANIPNSWNPSPRTVEEAASDLTEYVRRITGAELEIQRVTPSEAAELLKKSDSEGTVILLGSLAMEHLGARTPEMEVALADPSGFAIRTAPHQVLVAGSTPTAVSCAIHAMLEHFGVRWFFPGPLGTVVPESADLDLPLGDWIEKPTFASRYFQNRGLDEWMRRLKMGGLYFPAGTHGIPIGNDVSLETHPEFYALVNGQRTERQLCISNPEILRRAIASVKAAFREHPDAPWYGMGPNDGGGFCQCSKCTALDGGDWDPFSADRGVTDRYVWFFNQLLEGIKDEFPDKKICFYVYHTYMRPPVKVKPDPRIVPAIAPIGLCRVHGLNNPVCPERSYLKEIVTAWKALLPEVYAHGYWFNLADPGMLFIQTHRMRDEIPYYASQQIAGFRTECVGQWAAQGPSLYVAAKLMWNAKADPDAIVHDFCTRLFGPGAQPMIDYFELLDRQMRDSDYHTGSAFNLVQFYPKDIRQKAKALIESAQALATESPYRERLAIFAEGFFHADAFAEMEEAVKRQDWAAAHGHLQEMDRMRQKLLSYDPPMLTRPTAERHLERFFRHPVEQGYQRTSGGNRLVVRLEDRWDFLTDPQNIGSALNYQRVGLRGGNWQSVPTWSSTWSDQGMRYYRGLVWYRQTVDIPAEFEGKRIFLWFGGVDESARVWVNGEMIGTGPTSAFTPFELDATPAVRPGRNEITVCVANQKTDELGTGGITSPAFLYAPAKGMEAQLENLKPLRETFP